ncbi:MAG: prepilin-type N-terminal cleavage/methylation domain-containing protein [Candidatus Omnitrophota bacterium]
MKIKGFTLIELIIVVVLIGILVSLAAPNYLGKAERARDEEAKTVLKLIAAAEKIYALKHNNVYYVCGNAFPCTAELNQELNLDLPVNNSNWAYGVNNVRWGAGSIAIHSVRQNVAEANARTWSLSIDDNEIVCSGEGCPNP